MAYSNFTLAKVKQDFELTVDETQNLFNDIATVDPSEILTVILQDYIPLANQVDKILGIMLNPIQASGRKG